jgi:biotin operon repressor
MAEQLGITKRAIAKHTKKLQDSGRIQYVGPSRGGHWEIGKP